MKRSGVTLLIVLAGVAVLAGAVIAFAANRPGRPSPDVHATAPASPRPAGPAVVQVGASCSPEGATGLSTNGERMLCGTTPTDADDRWHAVQVTAPGTSPTGRPTSSPGGTPLPA